MLVRSALARLLSSISVLGLVCVAGEPAQAQCLDWAPGFDSSGHGLAYVFRVNSLDLGTGSKLYATGGFVAADGIPTSVVSWNGSGWDALGGPLAGQRNALEVFDDGTGTALYVGGDFVDVAGQPAQNFARWDGTAWTPLAQGTNQQIRDLVVFDEGSGAALYACGSFTTAGGVSANRVARWDGSSWSALDTGMNSDVYDLCVHDDGTGDALYACGTFTQASGVLARHIARWDGAAWHEVGTGLAGSVAYAYSMVSSGTQLYAGGSFTVSGSTSLSNVALWNGSAWSSPAGGLPNTTVWTLALHDSGSGPQVHAGGSGYTPAVYRLDGSLWTPLSSGIGSQGNATCRSMASGTFAGLSVLWVGGQFATAGGIPSASVGVWGIPCYAPVFTTQPQNTTATFPDPVVLSCAVVGTAPLSYQWFHDGVALSDGPNVIGTQTPTLTLFAWNFSSAGNYVCEASNPLGTTPSQTAVLSVPAGGHSGVPIEVATLLDPPLPIGTGTDMLTGMSERKIASSGEVAILGVLNGPIGHSGNSVVALLAGGTASLIAQQGDPAPGTGPGVTFGSCCGSGFGDLRAAAGGQLCFGSHLLGPGTTGVFGQGIWYSGPTGIQLVVRGGDTLPGSPSGATITSLSPIYGLSDAGVVDFRCFVYGPSGGGYGFWSWQQGVGTSAIAVTGQQAPGGTQTWTDLESALQVAPNGNLCFIGGLSDGRYALFSGQPGALARVACVGDPVPAVSATTTIDLLWGHFAISNSGAVAFDCRLNDGSGGLRRAILKSSASGLQLVALESSSAPVAFDPAATFTGTLRPVAINNAGHVLFSGTYAAACPQQPCSYRGMFFEDGTLHAVMLNFQSDSQLPPPYYVADWQSGALNDFDCVIVQGLANMNGYLGLWGWSETLGLFPLVIPGSQVEIHSNDFGTATDARLPDPLPYLMDAASCLPSGEFAFNAGFFGPRSCLFKADFLSIGALFHPPGLAFCAGDGSLGTPCPCANIGLAGHGCENSAGTGGAELSSSGVASLVDDRIVLVSSGELPTASSVVLQGSTEIAAGVVFGDGVRCVGGVLKRLVVRSASAGTLTYPAPGDLPISTRSANLGDPIAPGSSRMYQVYYRDPALGFCPTPPGNSWNVSNGQRVLWYP